MSTLVIQTNQSLLFSSEECLRKGTFEFTAEVIDSLWNEDIAKKVLSWYKSFGDDLSTKLSNIKIEHISGHRYRGMYNIKDISNEDDLIFELRMVVDPDDDGNYPITINRKKYIVIGKLTKINNIDILSD